MVYTVVQQRAIGAEPKLGADLHSDQVVGEALGRQYPALKSEDLLSPGEPLARKDAPPLVWSRPYLEFGVLHGFPRWLELFRKSFPDPAAPRPPAVR